MRYIFEELVDVRGLRNLEQLLVEYDQAYSGKQDLPQAARAAKCLAQGSQGLQPVLERVWNAIAALETDMLPQHKRLVSFLRHVELAEFAEALDGLVQDLQEKCPTNDAETLKRYFSMNLDRDSTRWLESLVGKPGADRPHVAKECLSQRLSEQGIPEKEAKQIFNSQLRASKPLNEFVWNFGRSELAIVDNNFGSW